MFRLVLIAGDLLVLFLFVLAGRHDHDMAFSLSAALGTAVPFALGWFAALLVFRTYREKAASSVGKSIMYALLTCCLAVPIGLGLRSVWLGRPPTGTFAVVAFPLVGAFMSVWRAAFAALLANRLPRK